MIELEGVCTSYGAVKALDGLSLNIRRGEFVVLIGASGSGKSTLLKTINRLAPVDAGRVLFDGQPIESFKLRDLRLRMGYAIQSVGLFPHWSVARNIGCVPRLLGWSDTQIANRVTALLELFDLDPGTFRHRLPHALSGGQQQRVGVARALAADPDVLLMDEPFGALDPVIRAALQREILRVHRSTGKTIVMVTHDINEALALATRIVLLAHGRVLQDAAPLQLLAAPANPQVLDFLGRSDIGLQRLSLQSAISLVRAEPARGGDALPISATLRDAVSLMAARQQNWVDVQGAAGQHAGVLHAADVFSPPHG